MVGNRTAVMLERQSGEDRVVEMTRREEAASKGAMEGKRSVPAEVEGDAKEQKRGCESL